MRPFYASALIFLTVCSLWIAADTPYTHHHTNSTTSYNVGFGSLGIPRH